MGSGAPILRDAPTLEWDEEARFAEEETRDAAACAPAVPQDVDSSAGPFDIGVCGDPAERARRLIEASKALRWHAEGRELARSVGAHQLGELDVDAQIRALQAHAKAEAREKQKERDTRVRRASWSLHRRAKGAGLLDGTRATCRRATYDREMGPHIKVRKGAEGARASLSGVVTCKSAWACPICAATIRQRRAGAIRELDEWAAEQGWHGVMVTLKVRHGAHDELSGLVRGLTKAWGRLRAQRPMRDALNAPAWWIRALEVTWSSRNGWHPHLHVAWWSPEPWSVEDAELRLAWQTAVRIELGEARMPDLTENGVHVRKLDLATYLSKLDMEIADPTLQKAGETRDARKTVSPWAVLERAITAAGDIGPARASKDEGRAAEASRRFARYKRLWEEWQLAMRGRRLHAASHGLLPWWEAEAAEALEAELIAEIRIPLGDWGWVAEVPSGVPDLLQAAEAHPDAAAEAIARTMAQWPEQWREGRGPPRPGVDDGWSWDPKRAAQRLWRLARAPVHRPALRGEA